MLIDTHAHIYLEHFDADREEAIARAKDQGIRKILLPNIDSSSIQSMQNMARDFPGLCIPMMGLHPTSIKHNYTEEFSIIQNELLKGDYVAVGEIGIDMYWDKTRLREQSIVFERELDLALKIGKPVVIHARESFAEIFELLEKYRNKPLRGIFHAFSGNIQQAQHVINMGFFLGIGGMVTYKNSGIDGIVKELGLEHMVLETDSPFLSPAPYRGKRNEPAFLTLIAEAVARIKSLEIDEVDAITTTNASRLFNLNLHDAN
jgi:TatD DNase family protein